MFLFQIASYCFDWGFSLASCHVITHKPQIQWPWIISTSKVTLKDMLGKLTEKSDKAYTWFLDMNMGLPSKIGGPDSKVRGTNMGPNWVLSVPGGPHVGPMKLAVRGILPHFSPMTHICVNANSALLRVIFYRLFGDRPLSETTTGQSVSSIRPLRPHLQNINSKVMHFLSMKCIWI